MKEMILFKNDEIGVSIRTITIDGVIWFIAKDVADYLGYKDSPKAITTHCKKSIVVGDICKDGISPSLDGKPLSDITPNWKAIKMIPESDIYRLVMKSELQSAIDLIPQP